MVKLKQNPSCGLVVVVPKVKGLVPVSPKTELKSGRSSSSLDMKELGTHGRSTLLTAGGFSVMVLLLDLVDTADLLGWVD